MKENIAVTGTIDGAIVGHTIGKAPPLPNTIIFHSIENGDEMMKISPDGFYVRGEKIQKDGDEVRKVYDAFVSWLKTTGLSV